MESPIPLLSNEAYTEALSVIKIQESLFSITRESYPTLIDVIIESVYVTSNERVEELSHHILEAVKYRVKWVALYADLLESLHLQSDQFPSLEKLPSYIIAEIATEITSERVGRCAMQLIQFLSKCFIRQIYTNSEIINFIRTNIHSQSARQVPVLHIFSHFCYLIEELDPPLYKQHIKLFNQIIASDPKSSISSCSAAASIFLGELEGWKKDKWFALRSLLSHDYNGLTVEGAAISDDLEAIMNISVQPDFSPNGRMQTNLFTPSNMLETNPTLIQYLAYFGSEKCFKYLLSLKADVTIETYPNCPTIYFASAGGNKEIIDILYKKHNNVLNFEGCSQYSAMYSNYNLLIWAIENIDKNIEKADPNLGTAFECAATSNFLKGMLYFFEKGAEINVGKQTGTGPLFYACVFGQIDAIRLLLSHKGIDPNAKDAQGVKMLFFDVVFSS